MITDLFGDIDPQWLILVGGVVFILILIQDPNGMVSANAHGVARIRARFARPTPRPRTVSAALLADVETVSRPAVALRIEDLTVRYGAVVAVSGLDLEVHPGEVVGLIGANGAGKTSVIDAVTGFARSSGAVRLGGVRIDGWPAHRRARAGLSRSFQSLELFEDVTVAENLLTAAHDRGRFDGVRDLVRPRVQRLQPAAVAAVRDLELEEFLDHRPSAMPFGRRRLVAIARALASGPSVLLLDEPAAGLDQHETAELSGLIRRLAQEWGLGVLLVEHDMSLVMAACDRVTVMDFGVAIAAGTPAEITRDDAVRRAYLGLSSDGQASVETPAPA